jgi:hypothetical protein
VDVVPPPRRPDVVARVASGGRGTLSEVVEMVREVWTVVSPFCTGTEQLGEEEGNDVALLVAALWRWLDEHW